MWKQASRFLEDAGRSQSEPEVSSYNATISACEKGKSVEAGAEVAEKHVAVPLRARLEDSRVTDKEFHLLPFPLFGSAAEAEREVAARHIAGDSLLHERISTPWSPPSRCRPITTEPSAFLRPEAGLAFRP